MGSALRRYKNAKAALYNVKNAKIRIKELLGRRGEIHVSNQQRERERQGKRESGTHVFGRKGGDASFLVSPSFGRKTEKERKGKEKKKKGKKERRKVKKEGKEIREGKGVVAGHGRWSPAAAGDGRRWPESGEPSPSKLWGCKCS